MKGKLRTPLCSGLKSMVSYTVPGNNMSKLNPLMLDDAWIVAFFPQNIY